MCKSSVYFSAPHFRLVPPHFGSSGEGTVLMYARLPIGYLLTIGREGGVKFCPGETRKIL